MKPIELQATDKKLITLIIEKITYVKRKSETETLICFDNQNIIVVKKNYNEIKAIIFEQ